MGNTGGKEQVMPLGDTGDAAIELDKKPVGESDGHGEAPTTGAGAHTQRKRQVGVSAEKIKKGDDMEFIPIPKSEEAKVQIAKALKTNALFLNMDDKQMEAIIDAMERTVIPEGNYACKVGQPANHFYTIESGTLITTIPHMDKSGEETMKFVRKMTSGMAFGEAFLFNVKRTASCQAETEVVIWGISRDNFRKVLKKLVQNEHRKMIKFLDSNLPFMKELKDDDLHHLLKAIEIVKYKKDQEVIKEGDLGSGLYIVYEGEVAVIVAQKVRVKDSVAGKASVAMGDIQEGDEDDEIDEGATGITAPSEISHCGGELILTMPAVVQQTATNERKSMKQMSVVAAKRVAKAETTFVEVKRIKTAGFFGERSMLVDEPAIATVKCTMNTSILKIDKFFFMRYLSPIPSISERCRTEYGVLVLKSVPVLRDLDANQRKEIKSLLAPRWYSPGEYLIKQGDESRTFFIIASGEVKLEQTLQVPYDAKWKPEAGKVVSREEFAGENGEKMMNVNIELGKLFQGQYFGESGLHDNSERGATVVAETEVYCFCLSRENFQKLLSLRGEDSIQMLDPTYKAKKLEHSDVLDGVAAPTVVGELSGSTIDDFTACPEILGAGAFGEVKMVKYAKNQKLYAAKIIQKKNMEESGNALLHADLILQEVRIMAEIEPSPFILRLHSAFKDRQAMYIITDLVDGQELYQMLQEKGTLLDAEAHKFIAANVVLMLEHLQNQSIVYRDLKPENLIVDHDGYCKMIDFGFARRIKNRTWTFCGSPDYLAPEILTCVGHDCMVDWWSFGVLLFEIVTGGTPFHDESHDNPYQTYSNIIMGNIVAKCRFKLEHQKECTDLIQSILKRDRTQRLPFHGVDKVKEHPWFKGLDWVALKNRTLKPHIFPGHQMTKKMGHKYKDSAWIPLQLEDYGDADSSDWFDSIEWNFVF